MKNQIKTGWAVIVLLGSMLACNLPIPGGQVELPATPTPDATMTAIFASGILGSLTPLPEVSDTPTSTHTPIPATLTPVPSETLTQTAVPPTITNTVTPPPTLTPGGPASGRPGPYVAAAYMGSAPNIDGNWDEWGVSEYPASAVVYGGNNWVNSDDLSSSFRIGWNANYLFIAAHVRDDVYAQNASGYDIYKGDSLEILLDTNLSGDFYYNVLSADDYQLGISAGRPDVNGTKEAYLWFPRSLQGAKTNVQIAAVSVSGGYQVEAAIPWGVFNVAPYAGLRMGFSFSVSDNDNTSTNIQQSMISNNGGRHLTLPMTWGELYLSQ